MTRKLRNIKYHPDLLNNDLPYINDELGDFLFETFSENFNKEISRLHKEPIKNTAPLKKPRLSNFGYRKVKFHWGTLANGEKPKMRIIYRYVQGNDTLQILAVGFRYDEPNNIYNNAETRDDSEWLSEEN